MTKQKAWKVTLSGYRNAHALRSALVEAGVTRVGLADDLLRARSLDVQQEELECTLIIRSVEQLGFTGAVAYEKICTRVGKRGFELCPAAFAPSLSLQPSGRLSCDMLYLGMQPMTDSDGLRAIFGLGMVAGTPSY